MHLLEQQFLHLQLQGFDTLQTPRFKFMTLDPWITWSIAIGSLGVNESDGVSMSLMVSDGVSVEAL